MSSSINKPPLKLSAKLGAWRMHDEEVEKHNDDYQQIRNQVLRRDKFTCQFCNFKSASDVNENKRTLLYSGFLECHHLDDDHSNNVPSNVITACPFCHQVFHTGNAGHRNAANIALMPFLKQEDINMLFNLLAVCKAKDESLYHDVVQDIEDLFTACIIAAEDIEPGLSKASNFGSIFIGLSIKNKEAFENIESLTWAMRMVPDLDSGVFDKAVQYWSANDLWIPERQWKNVLKGFKKSLSKKIQSK